MNKANEPKRGVIFDLDGTLWDSSRQVGIAWNEVFRREGVDIELTPERMTVMMGRTVPEIGEAMLPFIEEPRRTQILKKCCAEENRRLNLYGGEPFPHALETVARLSQKYPLFIVSNCEDGYIESFLNYHKMHRYFADTECIGRTGLHKAGNIMLICRRNSLERAVYIGDTARDMHSAEEAGIPFIFAEYGFGRAPEAKYSIEGFLQLEAVIEEIFGNEE